jgi:recombination protein RecA
MPAKKTSATPAKKAAKKATKAPAKKVAVAKNAMAKFEEQFSKSFGDGSLIDADDIAPYEIISTGSLLVDDATGVGGYVEGRLYELWGPDALGKTSFALLGLAEAQKKYPNLYVAFMDVERTFDKGLAIGMGVDINRMKLIKPSSAEEVADQMKLVLQSGLFSAVLLDSIGAMIPEAEKEKDADEAVVALQAKIVTRMVKIAAVEADRREHKTLVIFINQVRANVGGYGAKTTTGGGFALKHVTTGKFKFRRTATEVYKIRVEGENVVVGHELAVEMERNKVAPPKKVATINLMNQDSVNYGPRGIDKAAEAVTLGLRARLIIQRGGYYDTPDGQTVQGRDKLTDYYREHPELIEKLRADAIALRSAEIIVGEAAAIDIDAIDENNPSSLLENLDDFGGTGLFVGEAAE